MRNTIPQETIDSIRSMGFKVYMRNPSGSYAYVESDDGICYIQYDRMSGYDISTAHKPNRSTGTGFRMYSGTEISKDKLVAAIQTVNPMPGSYRDPTKYENMDDYIKSDRFNSAYKEVI